MKYNHGKDLLFFINNQEELVKKYDGKNLLIVFENVVGVYKSKGLAYKTGIKKYGEENFSLQKCIARIWAYTVITH